MLHILLEITWPYLKGFIYVYIIWVMFRVVVDLLLEREMVHIKKVEAEELVRRIEEMGVNNENPDGAAPG